ncbi:hypothetical protein GCM10009850_112870 [Nonomuraea monospora]|uniref:DUF7660 domain-containing protein n=1 Tax=Nonomuraea monospora TaxID=568818 RepID=A0ABN3D201_9ACTN
MDAHLYELADQVVTRQDLARLVAAMAETAGSTETLDWENRTLATFLESLAAWIGSMDAYFHNQGIDEPDQPSWWLIGEMLTAAAIYE